MEIKLNNAIIAGIVLGIISGFFGGLLSCCCLPVNMLLFLVAGVWAVYMTRALIASRDEALNLGAIAGGITGVICGIVHIIVQFVFTIIFGAPMYFTGEDISSAIAVTGLQSILGSGAALICCLPVYIILGAIMGAIGGWLYYGYKK
jgi:hypothetical protein